MHPFTNKIMKIYIFIHRNESVQYFNTYIQSLITQPIKLNYQSTLCSNVFSFCFRFLFYVFCLNNILAIALP